MIERTELSVNDISETETRYLRRRNDDGGYYCETLTQIPPAGVPPKSWIAWSWLEGEQYTPLSPVTKSDMSAPTFWEWSNVAISCPASEHTVTRYYSLTEDRSPCSDVYSVHTYSDGRLPIEMKELALPQGSFAPLLTQSLLKAQASLRRPSGSLPMIFRERKATVRTIRSYSKAILNNAITLQRKDLKLWMKSLKRYRGNKAKLAKISKDIAGRHLEFVFGVMPLLDDITGLAEEFSKPSVSVRTGRGRQTSKIESTSKGKFDCTVVTTSSLSVRTALRYKIKNNVMNDAGKLGFNPIYFWYDATPLSFIVGWFSNLNYWFQALDPIPHLEFDHGYHTTMRKTVVRKELSVSSGRISDSSHRVVSGSMKSNGLSEHGVRIPILTEPGLTSPQLVDNFGLFAATASTSLMIQRFVKELKTEVRKKPFKHKAQRPRYLPPIKYRKV